ncbi:hypothetical protein N792_01560 [Lysobacter concretionis Ko07 = DSM 16239]|uniref:Uncharacterized protein n=1 Tax=Lysobacter concretionis Ko07 = DSM 16239 TaxID=1122185 RepID=A0A0A0ES48_9GAMM|nr:DUF4915 domain-containing protein [Lysobacter concretionis]KGM52943.1 hypothetical protein N792_01560 [Lysobacter concretionis Ko07 = DSM 16239]
MTSVFNNLLVTSPNGGGIFFVHGGAIQKLDALDSTGLSVSGRRVLRGIQPSLVVLYQGTPMDINPTDIAFGDVHDVLIDGDSFYLVSTQGNEVVRFDAGAIEEERWTLPGEDDAWHVNCLAKWNGRLVFSAFGEFSLHREYKGATKDQGFVQDLRSGERLITGLSQPHSLFPHGQNLMVANSGEMALQEYAADGSLLRSMSFDGYVRGVSVSGGCIFVGLSRSRNLPQAEAQTASLVALDAVTWDEIARLSLPTNEVYDVHAVEAREASHVVALIAAHSSAILSSIITDKSERLRDLNVELRHLERERDSLGVALEQINAVETRLMKAIEQREEIAGARNSSTFAASLDALAASVDTARTELQGEHARQIAGLMSLVSDLESRAGDMHDELLAKLDHATALQSRISQLEGEHARQIAGLMSLVSDLESRAGDMHDELLAKLDHATALQSRISQLEGEHARQIAGLMSLVSDLESRAGDMHDELLAKLDHATALQSRISQLEGEHARQIAGLMSLVSDLESRAGDMHDELLAKLDHATALQSRIRQLEGELSAGKEALSAEANRAEALKDKVRDLEAALAVQSEEFDVLQQEFSRVEGGVEASLQRMSDLEAELQLVYGSRSMQLTRPLRSAAAAVRRVIQSAGPGVRAFGYLLARPGRYLGLAKGKSVGEVLTLTRGFLSRGGPEPAAPQPVRFDLRSPAGPVVILTTRHCEYIAREMHGALARVGIASEIIFEQPAGGYVDVPHFVICPHMFPVLPGFYVAFQMEQSVSSRWFTEDYMGRLENSFAIFDYSTRNISFLKEKGLSLKQVYYLPVGHLPDLSANPRPAADADEYDVVFYGDASNERRRAYLQELRKYCRIRVVSEVFGEELYSILAGAKLVVNIHYYAGALMETTRVWECLSLGKLVVSERSTDMEDHGELEGLVDFVEIDDIPAMVRRVRYWLEHGSEREERVRANEAALADYFNRFDYFFYRFLLATDNISFDEFWRESGHKYRLESDRLCLNLPEYTDRSRDFARDNHYGFTLFPGLRHSKGWLGCAMSYKYMIMLAREHGLDRVTICEDDVEFPADFEEACASIDAYLSSPDVRWDIFSGLMADLHRDAKILAVDEHEGRSFVTTNRLISTVMNIYSPGVFDTIVNWDETNRDVETNTIDRYLEARRALKVIVTEPFLVGHKEEQHSTIWGFQNTQYADLIAASSQLLKEKVRKFRARRGLHRGKR